MREVGKKILSILFFARKHERCEQVKKDECEQRFFFFFCLHFFLSLFWNFFLASTIFSIAILLFASLRKSLPSCVQRALKVDGEKFWILSNSIPLSPFSLSLSVSLRMEKIIWIILLVTVIRDDYGKGWIFPFLKGNRMREQVLYLFSKHRCICSKRNQRREIYIHTRTHTYTRTHTQGEEKKNLIQCERNKWINRKISKWENWILESNHLKTVQFSDIELIFRDICALNIYIYIE